MTPNTTTDTPAANQPDPQQQHADRIAALEAMGKVDRVVPNTDGTNGAMVILDWVTDSYISDTGTRIIRGTEYDGHINDVTDAIQALDGVERVRIDTTGIARCTIHVRFTGE